MAQGIEVNCATGEIAPVDVALPTAEELRAAISPVTSRQARLALFGAGMLAQAEQALQALPSPEKEAALIEWEYAAEVQRSHPLITAMAEALGLSDEQIDDLFRSAAAIA